MKHLLGLLFLLSAYSATAQIIGMQGNYNFAIPQQYAYTNVKQKPLDASVAGIYFDAPIYKNLHYTIGVNYMHLNQDFIPLFGELIPGYEYFGDIFNFNLRRDLIELPVGISYGIVAKNSNRVQLWAHANYAYGQMILHKYTYSGYSGDHIEDEKITKDYYSHSFKAELEVRFRLSARYFVSVFGSYRYFKSHIAPTPLLTSYYIGTGIRLGLNLPKKAE